MKLSKTCLSLFVALTGSLAAGQVLAHDIVPGKAAATPVLLTGLTVHSVTSGVSTDTDVLIADGKIAAIGKDLAAPEGATVMALDGKHLYPGLIALANQLGLIEIEAVRSTDDSTEVTQTNPDIRAKVAYNADSEVIPTIRSNGFAYAMVYPSGSMLMGQSSLMQLDAWNYQDAVVADATGLHVRWPNASTLGSRWNPKPADEVRKANAEQLEALQQHFKDAKAYYDAEQAGLNHGVDSRWHQMLPVFNGERPLFVHADDERQIRQAMLLAKQYGLKLTIVGGRDSWRMADELAAAKVAVIYTAPYGLPTRVDENFRQAFITPKVLQDAGVQYALSLDGYWDTRNLVFAAGQAISYGLTPEQALRSVTINAAQIAGVADTIGSIEVGKAASLVVSDGDIFDYLGHKVTHLWIDGRAVDLNNRHKQLHDKYRQRIN
ncbi:amidohydrolase family protein [Rheinheimera aquimaris]|jgi:imidazolonepropionase-like amidohydrolase|uniref:amidohydrolase family protein n=1 Tax=Rheinheimera aquimaris TaxID=412437 RepID=UPI001E5AB7D4|nr:amidohydrolase family protein [Rheinheimera aquimaris]MCD1600394.1 amidohydrolase family protein [Rheinheimera aquimaris]